MRFITDCDLRGTSGHSEKQFGNFPTPCETGRRCCHVNVGFLCKREYVRDREFAGGGSNSPVDVSGSASCARLRGGGV